MRKHSEQKTKIERIHFAAKCVSCLVLVLMYLYSFTRWDQWYHSHIIIKVTFFTLIYAAGIFAVLFKNNLSSKVNAIVSTIILVFTPVACYLIVECACSDWSSFFVDNDARTLHNHILNLVIFAFIVAFVFLFAGNTRTAAITGYLFSLILALTVYYVTEFRGVGFIASDFYSIGAGLDVAGEYSYAPSLGLYTAISICALAICVTFAFKFKLKLSIRKRLIMIVIALVMSFGFYEQFFGNYDSTQRISLFKPQKSYLSMGIALTVVRSCNYLVVEKPEGYSIAEVERIADKYRLSSGTQRLKSAKPNVIVIMDESFTDIYSLSHGNIKTNTQVYPTIASLEKNVYKGTLYQERKGGGTAIMEFEALTGNTNAFLPIGTIAYQNMIREEFPTLASQLKNEGYQGNIAYHPHTGRNYNRTNAYPLIGFDRTEFREDFDASGNNDTYGAYISDSAAFQQIIDDYEEYKRKSDAPFFAFQVTMQNHSPYEHAESHEIKITNQEMYTEELEQYLNYVHETDKALGKLISYYKKCEDPTLIVFFGDHGPGFEDETYVKLCGETNTSIDRFTINQTPLIIWANYDIGEKEYGDISENYISGEVIDAAGLEKTGYQNFLQNLRKDVVAINSCGYIGSDGNYYEIDDKSSIYYDKVAEYRILEYNFLIDRKNTVTDFFETSK